VKGRCSVTCSYVRCTDFWGTGLRITKRKRLMILQYEMLTPSLSCRHTTHNNVAKSEWREAGVYRPIGGRGAKGHVRP
jgi:hypothetical protein